MSDNLVLLPYEGMLNVVSEAVAAQLPVVATGVDGTAELVIPNKTGLLVPKVNPKALAEALIKLLANPELRLNLGIQGYQRILSEFSEGSMCENYERVLLHWSARKQ